MSCSFSEVPASEIQTRSELNGLHYFLTFEAADQYFREIDPTVWKISFTDEQGVRRRFVRYVNEYGVSGWTEEPLMDVVRDILVREGIDI